MVHAHAALPRLQLQLDAKRIIATSGVIALHIGVLMMLMMPMQSAQTEPEIDNGPIVTVPTQIKIPPILPLPKPLPRTPAASKPTVAQVPIAEPEVEPVDQSVGSLDTQAVDTVPSNTFEATAEVSPYVQLKIETAPAPPYPRVAEQRRITGTVTLRIRVDASGRPIEVTVENSSGSAILDQAALKFVKARWRFVPATEGGVPVEALGLVPIEFVLD